MSEQTPCPPWFHNDAEKLLAAAGAKRLHHALLVTGAESIGKQLFANWLSEVLLCESPTAERACGHCSACRQWLADAHADYAVLKPEGAGAMIKIDAVRQLVDWLQLTANANSYRVALICQADTLNHQAANSLLKTLEEPADNAVLILCTSRPGRLPATVRSRCQRIMLHMNDVPAAITWLGSQNVASAEQALAEANNAPLRALENQNEDKQAEQALLLKAWSELFMHKGSVGRIAESLSDIDTSECLRHFSSWCVMAAKSRAKVSVPANPAIADMLQTTRDCLTDEQWFTLHERLLQLHRSDSTSFKTKAVLEGVFADIRCTINA
ncbi:MAG: DNA polymerase III subunit delta' [Granulosicoccus sp.]